VLVHCLLASGSTPGLGCIACARDSDAGQLMTVAALAYRTPEAVTTHRLASQWSRFEANHPAQRKLGFLVLIIAELEERHGAAGHKIDQ